MPEVIPTRAVYTFASDGDTGIVLKCGVFVDPDKMIAGVRDEGGREWIIPLKDLLVALTLAGLVVKSPNSST